MTADERERASDVEPVRGTRLPPGRSIPRGELRSLFEVCAEDANDPRMRARGARDAAMLALLYVGGLRRTELASLRLSDYYPEERAMSIRGKGNKERRVYAEGGANLLLSAWLEMRGEGDPDEPLFLPVRKDGVVLHHAPPCDSSRPALHCKGMWQSVRRQSVESEVMWAPWEGPGLEHVRLATSDRGIVADGLVIGLEAGRPFRIGYEIRCDGHWRVREVRAAAPDSERPVLELLSDGEGHWKRASGEPVPELDGCIDVDISATPFTNALPIRRLGLEPG